MILNITQVVKNLKKKGISLTHFGDDYCVMPIGASITTAQYTKDINEAIQIGNEMAQSRKIVATTPSQLLNANTDRRAYEDDVIATAVSYSICRKNGVGPVERRDVTDINEIPKHVLEMGVDQTMVYAINKSGRFVLMLAGGKPVRN